MEHCFYIYLLIYSITFFPQHAEGTARATKHFIQIIFTNYLSELVVEFCSGHSILAPLLNKAQKVHLRTDQRNTKIIFRSSNFSLREAFLLDLWCHFANHSVCLSVSKASKF